MTEKDCSISVITLVKLAKEKIMTKNFIKICLLLSLVGQTYAKREIVKISNLNIATNKDGGTTLGKLSWTDFNVDFGGNIISANNQGEPLNGSFSINDQKFNAKLSFATYKTELSVDNPLITLDHLHLKDAQVNFDKDEMSFETPSLKIGTNNTTVSAKSLKGSCDPKGDPSTDIDIVCLSNGDLKAQQAQLINDTINILTNSFKAYITPATIAIDASKNVFSSNGADTLVAKLKADCSNGIRTRFNIEDFISGCLKESHIALDGFSQIKEVPKLQLENKELANLQDIKYVKVDINENRFFLLSRIRVLFLVNLKVSGEIEHLPEDEILKLKISKAYIAGIPAKTLTLSILQTFLEEDSIQIKGDTIYIAL